MFERRLSTNSQSSVKMNSPRSSQLLSTPTKSQPGTPNSNYSPTISRYGRSHKPKMQDDYVSTDKKVSAYLKLSPGNQIKYYNSIKEPKKKSPAKSLTPEGTVKRGRPRKLLTKSQQDRYESIIKSLRTEPQDPNMRIEGLNWMVGDLGWGRVGGHPFWPCVVTLDPVTKIWTKIVQRGKTTVGQRWLHVQFFGDNGRRSWLNVTAVIAFLGRESFIELRETIIAGMRKKDPKMLSAFVIKPAVIQVWEKAVQEAEDLLHASREERIGFFATHFPAVIQNPLPIEAVETVQSPSTPTPSKRGRKRKAEGTPLETETKVKQIKLENIEIKQEPEEVPQETAVVKQDIKIKVEPEEKPVSPTLLTTTPRTIADRKKRQALLMQMARSNQMTPATPPAIKTEDKIDLESPAETHTPGKRDPSKGKDNGLKEECALEQDIMEVEGSSEDNEVENQSSKSTNDVDVQSSKSSSPAPSPMVAQKPVSTKRSTSKNLFSGVSSGKVCLICEKAGDTVRCRGPCQGFYHPECVINPPAVPPSQPTPIRKNGKKSKSKKSIGLSPTSSPQPLQNGTPSCENKTQNEINEDEDCLIISEKEQIKETKEVIKEGESNSEESADSDTKSSSKIRKGSKDSDSGEEGEGFRCKDCQQGRTQPCFACHQYERNGETKMYRCITAKCGKVYHEECLKSWPQTSWRSNGGGKGSDRGVLTCPQHTCHTCVSDNPGVIKARYSNDKLVRCVRCPTSYHYGNHCLPAGSEILTTSQIICPQHYQPAKKGIINHVNAAWCFICASGGSLICCDLCPTAFHADCLNISTPPETYVCEDCQTGRFPLYGEIVWVKLGCYRWWPAQILYPSQIPDNILNLPHVRGEFAVRFFGSHDHYWVNRGRVFLYQDGDTAGKGNYKKSSVDQMFERAVKEASEAQRKNLEQKATRDAETRPGMKPPNYVKLKTNKPVGNVRTMELNLSNLTPCECDPNSEKPCAPETDCLNRILMVECNPMVCPAGEKCHNQLFEKRQYPPLQPYQTQERGWGLKTLVPLKKGDFVIEYVGEMIDEEEYKRRLAEMHERNEDNFYFLTIDKDRMLDAGPKGNVARFMNHSCQPNCETQKWTVNGDTRVGLFAVCDIPADTELVFNYNLESTGNDKKPCMCGAPNCSGFIGVKAVKHEKEENKEKKPVKKKKSISKSVEGLCFMCGKSGDLLRCNGKLCTKGYHLSCLGKKQHPQGYWLCPWHQCNVCNKGRVRRCSICVNSYCQEHSEGNIHEEPNNKLLFCTKHHKNINNATSAQIKESPMLTDIDGDSSDNSTLTSSQSCEVAPKEFVNNNVLKAEDVPKLRNKRSKSFAGEKPNSNILVNGSAEKISTRKKRPSSVDEALLLSHEKTGSRNKKNRKLDDKISANSNGVTDVKEILESVINKLQVETKRTQELENQIKIEEKIEILNGDIKKIEETFDENKDSSPSQNNDMSKTIIDTEESDKVSNSRFESMEKEIENIEDDCISEIKKFIENESKGINNSETTNGSLETDQIQFSDTQDNKQNKTQERKPKIVNEFGKNGNYNTVDKSQELNQDENSLELTLSESQTDNSCDGIMRNNEGSLHSVGLTDEVKKAESDQADTKEVTVENGLISDESGEKDDDSGNFTEESIKPESIDEGNKETTNLTKVAIDPVDDMDDFELSYSESSNDKLYKSTNDSEPSNELELINSDNLNNETESLKLEESSSQKDFKNGIEQSAAMEVA